MIQGSSDPLSQSPRRGEKSQRGRDMDEKQENTRGGSGKMSQIRAETGLGRRGKEGR